MILYSDSFISLLDPPENQITLIEKYIEFIKSLQYITEN